jgi:RNA polymerase subunit RPABC4/transcription elongation factor Spt4
MEEFILNLLESIGDIDFSFVWQIFFYGLIVFWLVVLYWVWLDSGDRTSNKIVRCSYVLLVAVLNVIGLIIYLIIRPGQTIEEIYWADLERRYLKYETEELGDCPQCGRQLFPGYTFCPNCRYKLKTKCTGCNVFIDKKNKFCPHCGQEVRKRRSPEEASPSKEVMEEQIKATKEEATDAVESKKTRYSKKGGFAVKVGESIVSGYKIMYGKVRDFFTKKEKERSKKQENKGQEGKKEDKKKEGKNTEKRNNRDKKEQREKKKEKNSTTS